MDEIDPSEECFRYGNDTSPLMNSIPEPPQSHWGKVTTDRSASEAYTKFLMDAKRRNREKKNGVE